MLTVHRSNRVETLLEALVEVLRVPVGPPTVRELVAVQSRGMETWLSMELSQRFGIWAGGEFPFPRALLDGLFDAVLGGRDEDVAPCTASTMTWSVLAELPGCLDQPGFAPLARYLRDDRNGLKAYGLARRIAGVLDQYAVYRPELLLAWEGGEDGGWQAELHRRLVSRHDGGHVAARGRAFLEAMERGEYDLGAIPARMSLFGISTLPPLYTQVLAALPESVAVHLFLLDAGTAGEEAHPLADSMGGQAREFRETISATGEVVDDARYTDPSGDGPSTLLARLQSDILHGTVTPHVLDPGDRSVALHSCHSPMREVEVLHDQLRHLLETDPSLEPHHVVIMTPDVETYAPFVDAVFSSAGGSADIPYRISDRSDAAAAPAVEAFRAVLALARSRMTAPAVLDVVAMDAVRGRFGLEHEDVEAFHHWVQDTGIRWGTDADHRAAVGQPPTPLNTWRFGLDRLLLGYALPGETLFGGILPWAVEDTDLLGRFVDLCETLLEQLDALKEPRPIALWCDHLSRAAAAMLSDEGDLARGHQMVLDALADLARLAADAGHEQPVDRAVVQRHLDDGFDQSSSARGFLSGGVTVCNLLPMRSIPFRVVCLLGMGYARFPRSRRSPGFDLISQHPRPGDRSTRADDRYLFLEALLGARQHLLVTYVGQSQRDNAELPPSVLVSELLDAIDETVVLDETQTDPREILGKQLVIHHPLQPFSPRYFRGDDRLFSYRGGYAEGARATRRPRDEAGPFFVGPMPDATESIVDIAQLQQFYRSPCRWFLQRRVGVRRARTSDPVDDREPITTTGLDDYWLGASMMRHAASGGDLEGYRAVVEASGALPLGTPGRLKYDAIRRRVEPIARAVREVTTGEELPPVAVNLALGGIHLTGQIDDLWPHAHVEYTHGSLNARHRVAAWLNHLVLGCVAPAGYPRRTLLVGRGKGDTVHVETFEPVQEAARDHLTDLLALYQRGQRVPLAFFPRTSSAFAEAVLACGTADDVWNAAWGEWEASWSGIAGEGDDDDLELLFRGADPFEDPNPDFTDVAWRICAPMLSARREVGE